MYLCHAQFAWKFHAVEDHTPCAVELRQLITVKDKPVFAIADYPHIGFEDLRRIVFAKYEVDIMVKPVTLRKFNKIKLLFKFAEYNHVRGFPCLLRLRSKHLAAKVHKFCGSEILVGVKKLLACKVAFSVLVVAANLPRRIAAVCVLADVIGYVRQYELRLRYAELLKILKVRIEKPDTVM